MPHLTFHTTSRSQGRRPRSPGRSGWLFKSPVAGRGRIVAATPYAQATQLVIIIITMFNYVIVVAVVILLLALGSLCRHVFV